MALLIHLSAKAQRDYFQILKYLHENWTNRELKNFANKVDKVLKQIAENPEMYPVSKKKDVHRCVITKQITLYYKLGKKEIFVTTLFDTRQHPNKLKT